MLNENNYAVLDRGFRDMKADLELKRINVLMPALEGKRKQSTTKELNKSRYVAKIRWMLKLFPV